MIPEDVYVHLESIGALVAQNGQDGFSVLPFRQWLLSPRSNRLAHFRTVASDYAAALGV